MATKTMQNTAQYCSISDKLTLQQNLLISCNGQWQVTRRWGKIIT